MKVTLARLVAVGLSLAAVPGLSLAEAGSPLTDTLSLGLGTFILNTNTDVRVDVTGDSFEGSLRWRYSGARIFVTVSL
jgi:hypothetical protein